MIKAINIKWDTDDEVVDLPSEVEIPEIGIVNKICEYPECDDWRECDSNSQSVNNYLSDKYGWCVFDYELVEV